MQKQNHSSLAVSLWFFIFTITSIFLVILKPHKVKASSIGCTAAPGSLGSELCLEIHTPRRGTYVDNFLLRRTYVDGIPPIPQNLCNYRGVITVEQPRGPKEVYANQRSGCSRGGDYYFRFDINRAFEHGSLVCGEWFENNQPVAQACNRVLR